MKALLYGLSLLIPIAGIIIGIVFISRQDPESKSIGQIALVLGVISFVLNCCVAILIWVVAFGGALPFLMDM
jgi:hypothetical protein